MFRGLNFTKHCNAQKIPKFPTPKLTKHCNAQKIPKTPKFFGESGLGLDIDARILEFLEFFEHYSVS